LGEILKGVYPIDNEALARSEVRLQAPIEAMRAQSKNPTQNSKERQEAYRMPDLSVTLAALMITEGIFSPKYNSQELDLLISRLSAMRKDKRRMVQPLAEALGIEKAHLFNRLVQAMTSAEVAQNASLATHVSQHNVVFLSADLFNNANLGKVVKRFGNLVIVFNQQQGERLSRLGLLQKEALARNIFFVTEAKGASIFVNRWFQPGDVRYQQKFPELKRFFYAQGYADGSMNPNKFAFVAAGSREANKVQPQFISRRFFFKSEISRTIPEVRFQAFELLLNTPDLFRAIQKAKAESVEEYLAEVFERLLEGRAAQEQLQSAA
jgi:hypothetical protein